MNEVTLTGGFVLLGVIITITFWFLHHKIGDADMSGREISNLLQRTKRNEKDIGYLKGGTMTKDLCKSKQETIETKLSNMENTLNYVAEKVDKIYDNGHGDGK